MNVNTRFVDFIRQLMDMNTYFVELAQRLMNMKRHLDVSTAHLKKMDWQVIMRSFGYDIIAKTKA